MDLQENGWCYWESLRGLLSHFRFLDLNPSQDVLELGHIFDERVVACLHDLAESYACEIALDCLVLEILFPKVSGELA